MDLISAVSFLRYIYLLQYWTTVLLLKKNIRGKCPNYLQCACEAALGPERCMCLKKEHVIS